MESRHYLNIRHPTISKAYELYRLKHRIPYGHPFSDDQRKAFEVEFMRDLLKAKGIKTI